MQTIYYRGSNRLWSNSQPAFYTFCLSTTVWNYWSSNLLLNLASILYKNRPEDFYFKCLLTLTFFKHQFSDLLLYLYLNHLYIFSTFIGYACNPCITLEVKKEHIKGWWLCNVHVPSACISLPLIKAFWKWIKSSFEVEKLRLLGNIIVFEGKQSKWWHFVWSQTWRTADL